MYEEVRYEAGRWPLWRWDQNLRYIAKSLAHRSEPSTEADARHHARMADYLRRRPWPEAVAHHPVSRWMAVGDLMWLRDGYADFLSAGLVERLEGADAIFANLETPVDPSRPVQRWVYETLHYNAPPSYLDAWRRISTPAPRVMSVVNNHAVDQGIAGLRATRREIEARPDMVCVGGADRLEDAVRLVVVGGERVAVVATTFGVNHLEREPEAPAGVPVVGFGDPRVETDWGLVARLLDIARRHRPDQIVMMPHWGYEYEYWPDERMRADARRLVTMGFDVILGSSPHVLQPVEVFSVDGWDRSCPVQIERGGAPRPAVVAWSLGDFASVIPTVACQTGAVLSLRWGRSADGNRTLADVSATPTVTMRGLGQRWIEAGVTTLEEYRHRPVRGRPWAPYDAHAARMLGPLMGR